METILLFRNITGDCRVRNCENLYPRVQTRSLVWDKYREARTNRKNLQMLRPDLPNRRAGWAMLGHSATTIHIVSAPDNGASAALHLCAPEW